VNEEKTKHKKPKDDSGPRISINNTLYLNTSTNYQSLNIESGLNNINASFDIKGNYDKNHDKNHDKNNDKNNDKNQINQMEMEDILLKMVLEEGEQKKIQENNGVFKEKTDYIANRLNTSFENNQKNKQNISVFQGKNEKKVDNCKLNGSFQNISFVNESRIEKNTENNGYNAVCCEHEEELKKAKQKIEHLSKKMKLITEENKVFIDKKADFFITFFLLKTPL